jgi:hypothetical protein
MHGCKFCVSLGLVPLSKCMWTVGDESFHFFCFETSEAVAEVPKIYWFEAANKKRKRSSSFFLALKSLILNASFFPRIRAGKTRWWRRANRSGNLPIYLIPIHRFPSSDSQW